MLGGGTLGYNHVKKVEYPLGNGCTEPLRAILDDDSYVVIKLFNNVMGNLVLLNEFVCYHLAKIIGLRIPHGEPCIIDENTIDEENLLKPENMGLCFGSQYLMNAVILNAGIIKKLDNCDDFYKLILFDHLIYNKDRNMGNLLTRLSKKDSHLYVIDHTHVFKNETIWCARDLNSGISNHDIKDVNILRSNEKCYELFMYNNRLEKEKLNEASEVFKTKLSYDIICDIIADIPDEWRCCAEDLAALAKYLDYRLKHIDDFCELIMNSVK